MRDPQVLVRSLEDGSIDAAVRGTLLAQDVIGRLLEAIGKPSLQRAVLIELKDGRSFLMGPVGIDEGASMEDRWCTLRSAATLVEALGEVPKVAIMSKGRPEDADRGDEIATSIEECEALRGSAQGMGIDAVCSHIVLEQAVEKANIVIAPDGVTGNLLFRSLHFLGGHESWGAVALGLLPTVFIDTSRNKADYGRSVKLARAIAAVERR